MISQHHCITYPQVEASEPSLFTTEPVGGKLPLFWSGVALLVTALKASQYHTSEPRRGRPVEMAFFTLSYTFW